MHHDLKSKHFHVSFILKAQRILAVGINNERKTNPNNLKYGYMDRNGEDISEYVGSHSELMAVRKLNEVDCRKYRLINFRIDRRGLLTSSRPCRGCQNLIKFCNFKEVWYSTFGGNMERL
jgi:deoxycytidylate deaminase